MSNPAAGQELATALDNLEPMTRRITAGEGSLGKLLRDEELANPVMSGAAGLKAVAETVNDGCGTAGRLVSDPARCDRLNALAERLDQLFARPDAGEGTVGQLLHDKQLCENMNAAASERRALVGEIRRDPKKYPIVKVGIF